MAKKGLTERNKRFVEEYLKDLNATKAAERAGYSKENARSIGCRLLAKPEIQEAIQEAMAARAKRTQITQDRIVKELAKIAFSDMRDYVEVKEGGGIALTPTARLKKGRSRAIAEVSETITQNGGSTKFKLYDKVKALELLGKHQGMFVERIGDPDGKPLQAGPTILIGLPPNGREARNNDDED